MLLVIALFATLSANVFINGVAFLIPTPHTRMGLDLAKAGLVSAMPSFGMVLTPDRLGLSGGPGRRAAGADPGLGADHRGGPGRGGIAPLVVMSVFLLLGGMAAASSNSASGRLVVGWFPPERRGLVMGIRQTAQPLGVGLGALVIPRLAQSHGVGFALLFPAAVCGVAALVCAVGVLDLPRLRAPRRPPTTWPTLIADPGCSGGFTRCRCCWWCRSAWCGPSPWVAHHRPRLVGGIGRRAW